MGRMLEGADYRLEPRARVDFSAASEAGPPPTRLDTLWLAGSCPHNRSAAEGDARELRQSFLVATPHHRRRQWWGAGQRRTPVAIVPARTREFP